MFTTLLGWVLSLSALSGVQAAPDITAHLQVTQNGNALAYQYTLKNALDLPFRAAYACTFKVSLVNRAGKAVRVDPPADAACQSTYRWIQVPARSSATVFQKTLPWNLAEVPPGQYRLKTHLQLFRVPSAFQTQEITLWSARFTIPRP